MLKMMRLFLTLCLLATLVAGVVADGRAARRRGARMDRNFMLRVGQEVLLADQKLKIKFVSVPEDSRCPTGVTCIWAGSARIALSVSEGKSKPISVELESNPRGEPGTQGGKFGNYIIKLVNVAPYPVEGQPLATTEYAVTLIVSKK